MVLKVVVSHMTAIQKSGEDIGLLSPSVLVISRVENTPRVLQVTACARGEVKFGVKVKSVCLEKVYKK